MTWFLVVPGALLPASVAGELGQRLAAGALSARLARAQAPSQAQASAACAGAAHLDWLARAFGVDSEPPVTAPYAWRALDPDPEAGVANTPASTWLCEPMHVAVGREHLLLLPLAGDTPGPAEDLALWEEAAQAAAADGLQIERRGGRWFLHSPHPLDLHTDPLEVAVGTPIEHRQATGADAPRWQRLATDIGLRWHQHPVNERREEQGRRTVNSLWLHGGGAWRPLPPARFGRVEGDDPVLQGWAAAAEGAPAAARGRDTLVVLATLLAPWLAKDWAGWLQQAETLQRDLEPLFAQAAAAAEDVALVLCGHRQQRTWTLPATGHGVLARLATRLRPAVPMERLLAEEIEP